MKRVLLLLLFVIFVPFSTTNAQSFNIPEGDFYIDLGDGNWQQQEEDPAYLPKEIIKQYYFTESSTAKSIVINVTENNMSKNIVDMSSININEQFLNGFENSARNSAQGTFTTLVKEAKKINTMNGAYIEFINNNPSIYSGNMYCRDFATIKNGKVIHFLFIYFDEQSLYNSKQKDIDTLSTVAFTKDSINDVKPASTQQTKTTNTANYNDDTNFSYDIGKIIGKAIAGGLIVIVFGAIVGGFRWLIKKISNKGND